MKYCTLLIILLFYKSIYGQKEAAFDSRDFIGLSPIKTEFEIKSRFESGLKELIWKPTTDGMMLKLTLTEPEFYIIYYFFKYHF